MESLYLQQMSNCTICPRKCGADRSKGKTGVCGVTSEVYVARAALHFWEEPCISGSEENGNLNGSGTVFFSGCNLKCVYCQNYELAHAAYGWEVSIERLSGIFLDLQKKGANNINLVTPSQYIPQIREALLQAKEDGLTIPIVCNCGGYEDPKALRLLDGIVDVYLTDFKYMDAAASARYSGAPDYPERAKEGLEEMLRQCPEAVFSEDGLMKKGVIVRCLLLPGMVRNTKQVVRYVYETYGEQVWFSLMNQYTPFDRIKEKYPELSRKATRREYNALVDYALDLGITQAFIQEGSAAKDSFIPEFDGEGVLY
ncbi:MAG: radical SAM protein [Eubacteriales bacterium]|nr:radical SAM protein [Eubacteriales bacterium]